MRYRVVEHYIRARESFWFLPAIFVVLAIVLSQITLLADRRLGLEWAGNSQLALGVDGSRGLLTTIGGSVLAVAGTAFSITISVIATASSSYGPRLVRNFMKDRGNQFVLGVFVATFAYCIIVLRSVTSENSNAGREAFVPYISVYLALLIALLNIGCLVYFIHHIADSIQVPTLIRTVRNELRQVAAKEYPQDPEKWDPAAVPAIMLDPDDGHVDSVPIDATGYLTGVDTTGLVSLAARHRTVIEIVPRVGDHLIATESVAQVMRTDVERDELARLIRKNITIGDARTPHQDIRFALQQLVEIAVRALSPGTNDPFTAQNAVEELGSGLASLAHGSEPPEGISDESGDLRLVLHRPRPIELVDLVFDDLRAHGSTEMRVVRPAIQLAQRVAEAGSADLAQRAWLHIELLLTAHERSGASDFDVERLRILADSSVKSHPHRPDLPSGAQ